MGMVEMGMVRGEDREFLGEVPGSWEMLGTWKGRSLSGFQRLVLNIF
jgi:hypothetical protein